ncbi:putative odorant receptor 92a [Halictus rubicundus]|uniref:putative odorant receptor 92a n=1 Tax=Halictus rubicundus TaxID=77578 RepID=UPI0040351B3B
MPTLKYACSVLTAIGCNQPTTWTSPTKKVFYKVYGSTVLVFVQLLTITTILDIVFNVRNQNDFGDNLYSTIPVIISCCKLCSFLANRDSIMRAINSMQEKPYSPDTDEEIQVESRFENLNDLAARVNEDFQVVLCVQFMSSVTIICFTLYRITQTDLGSRLIETVMYAVCMLLQIFYYCWYGNEVKLKSLEISDMIFSGDWVNLAENTKKTLLIIMIRSTFPIEFTSAHVLSVNIDSFMAVSMAHR